MKAARRRHMAAAAIAAVLALGLVQPARADFQAAVNSYDAGDYAAAFKEWARLAEQGDVAAMRNIGHMYRFGQGVSKDLVKAAEWYRRAADNGLDRAQANLANLYLTGEGVPQDYAAAAKWFELAARQGLAIAQYNLALLYERGMGVEQSDAKALGWFTLAAKQGEPHALQKLADLVAKAPPESARDLGGGVETVSKSQSAPKTEAVSAPEAAPAEPKTTGNRPPAPYAAANVTPSAGPAAEKPPVATATATAEAPPRAAPSKPPESPSEGTRVTKRAEPAQQNNKPTPPPAATTAPARITNVVVAKPLPPAEPVAPAASTPPEATALAAPEKPEVTAAATSVEPGTPDAAPNSQASPPKAESSGRGGILGTLGYIFSNHQGADPEAQIAAARRNQSRPQPAAEAKPEPKAAEPARSDDGKGDFGDDVLDAIGRVFTTNPKAGHDIDADPVQPRQP